MTIQELVDWCVSHDVSLDTHIALRAKDDYLLVPEGVGLDTAYFGNCRNGMQWDKENLTRDENGDLDYDNAPELIVLDTFR